MRIAIAGCRGIPGRYGGFETLAEQLSVRLAAKGHGVVVYCRARYGDADSHAPAGVKRVFLPALYTKHLETLSHTFLCTFHQMLYPSQVMLLLNNANAIFIPFLKIRGVKVFVHVDGLEWQRQKWGWMAKAWHHFSERLAVRWADGLISDSRFIQAYYEKTHGRRPGYAAYGSFLDALPGAENLQKFGLTAGNYFLFVGRLEPENHPDLVIEAYARFLQPQKEAGGRPPLIVVGWAPYARAYVRDLHRRGQAAGVRFLGPVYGEDYKALLHHCRAFVHASSVGGTHPVIVEAMGAGRPILLSDIPENRETAGETALFFNLNPEELAQKMDWLFHNGPAAEKSGSAARARAQELFQWDAVAQRYETFLAGGE